MHWLWMASAHSVRRCEFMTPSWSSVQVIEWAQHSVWVQYVLICLFLRRWISTRRRVASIFIGGTRRWRNRRSERSAKCRSAEGVGSGEGRCSPQKIFEKSMLKLHIFLWFYSYTISISNVWRVTPVAKQSSVCNSGAKNFFNPRRGDIHPCLPPLAMPLSTRSLQPLTLVI